MCVWNVKKDFTSLNHNKHLVLPVHQITAQNRLVLQVDQSAQIHVKQSKKVKCIVIKTRTVFLSLKRPILNVNVNQALSAMALNVQMFVRITVTIREHASKI